jgi:hypothetical protein
MGFLFRIVPPRQFKFKPRSYNPDNEVDPNTSKRRLHFRRLIRRPRQTPTGIAGKSMAGWILLALISLFLYWQLHQYTRVQKPLHVEPIKLEEAVP